MSKGLVKNNPVNDPNSKPVKGHSLFKPNMSHYYTLLFGYATPSFAMETVPGDKGISLRCQSDVDTMSLKSPLMAPINKHKDYFFVPLRAILRENADLLVTNPVTGEDIDAEQVNTVLNPTSATYPLNTNFSGLMTKLENLLNYAGDPDTMTAEEILAQRTLGFCLTYSILGMFHSDGSLMANLGLNLTAAGPQVISFKDGVRRKMYFDEQMEAYAKELRRRVKTFQITVVYPTGTYQGSNPQFTSKSYVVDTTLDTGQGFTEGGNYLSFRQFLELLRERLVFGVQIRSLNSEMSADELKAPIYVAYNEDYTATDGNVPISLGRSYPFGKKVINYSRLIAYQLACVQFYTTDSVDYVYSPLLWHQNMIALLDIVVKMGNTYDTWLQRRAYMLNGTSHNFDSISGKMVQYTLSNVLAYGNFFSSQTYYSNGSAFLNGSSGVLQSNNYALASAYAYLCNIFWAQRSLRYRDYFVGSKTRPMAVGDVNVAVNQNLVNVVDVTKNIQMQRFLNQVNRIGRTLKEYSRGIFGDTPAPDPRECVWLGTTTDVIGASETQNTGEAQMSQENSITSRLRSDSSRFAFEFDSSEFGWVIGINTFDIPRAYPDARDRQTMHVDRFDMFNPYLQHIGDQPVYGEELNPTIDDIFSYQLRYAEYKQRTDRASGGFRAFLPSWAFLAPDQCVPFNYETNGYNIGPDFIRSHSYELDKYFISLTNITPAGYFHFIVRDDYQVSASRPMEAAPSIL